MPCPPTNPMTQADVAALCKQHTWFSPLDAEDFPHRTGIERVHDIVNLEGKTVADLGCFEGYTTLHLARKGACVVGMEARVTSLQRAWLRCLREGYKVHWLLWDAEADPVPQVDLVFHAGLFYHLIDPVKHLKNLNVKDWIYLETHVSHGVDEQPYSGRFMSDLTDLEGYQGRWYREGGWKDQLSGINPKSFWFTKPALLKLAADNGLELVEEVYFKPEASNGQRGGWLFRRSQ